MDHRMSRPVNLRLASHESGNANDFNEYVYIGSNCIGFVWRELLPEHHHDYRVTRRVWKQSLDVLHEHPTRALAIRALVAALANALDYDEIDKYPPFKLRNLSRDEEKATA
jgi:hypothetical protein